MKPLNALAVLVAASLLSAAAFAGERRIASVEIPLDGSAISLEQMAERGRYRLEITGVFTCSIDGRTYDALYRAGPGEAFDQDHGLLIIQPEEAVLAEENAAAHRYVYSLPSEQSFAGESFVVRVDVDALIREFIRSPSVVRQSLEGSLRADLLMTPPALPISWILAAILLPLLAVGLVVGLMIQAARRAAMRPYEDVEAMRRRIDHKGEEALREIGAEEGLFDELRARVRELREGARELAEHVVTFRESNLSHSGERIEAELARLQKREAAARSEDVRRQCREQIAATRESLESLRSNQAREESYLERLRMVETTLDNLRLKLPTLRVGLVETGGDHVAVEEVDRELDLLRRAVDETREDSPPVAAPA